MRIALITETYPPEVNGVAMTNQRLVRGLIALGHQILLIKPQRSGTADITSPDLQVHDVFGLPIPTYPDLKVGLPKPIQLEHAFEVFHPNVVHIATEGPLGFSGLLAARKLGIPTTSTFHTNFQDYCADYGAAFAGQLMLRYLRWFHNLCASTTVPDEHLITRLENAGLKRLKKLGRGADTELFTSRRRSDALRASWGASTNSAVALYVGRVAAEKNIPLVLQAWEKARKKQPDLRMVVVGDGPIRAKLESQWPEVHFAGMRFDEDLAAHYASADLFLFASESETFGNVVVEALASSLVVLTYNYAAGRQFIRHRDNGFVVGKGDTAAFHSQLDTILQHRGDWPRIRQAARDTAEAYPWTTTIRNFSRILSDAAALDQDRPQTRSALSSPTVFTSV